MTIRRMDNVLLVPPRGEDDLGRERDLPPGSWDARRGRREDITTELTSHRAIGGSRRRRGEGRA
jgi:hypothetical protein